MEEGEETEESEKQYIEGQGVKPYIILRRKDGITEEKKREGQKTITLIEKEKRGPRKNKHHLPSSSEEPASTIRLQELFLLSKIPT